MSETQLIVGLGNPGRDYEHTRHNLGFLTVKRLAEKMKFKVALSSFTNGITAEGSYEGKAVCLLIPMTHMNNSGTAVRQVMFRRGIAPQEVLVVCDDFHLAFGRLRLRLKGSDGGHNGLKSIIQCLATDQFVRLRMGIGRPPDAKDTVDFVLEEFSKSEKARLDAFIDEAVACCLACLTDGAGAAMDRHNQAR